MNLRKTCLGHPAGREDGNVRAYYGARALLSCNLDDIGQELSTAGRQTVRTAACHAYEVAEGGSESLTKHGTPKKPLPEVTAKVTRLERT
ncbi:MAG: hypothetical protein CMP47_10335 [Rickettsiales bacterium]|nr:hypothetical protein [Rickettsiales bacterium]